MGQKCSYCGRNHKKRCWKRYQERRAARRVLREAERAKRKRSPGFPFKHPFTGQTKRHPNQKERAG